MREAVSLPWCWEDSWSVWDCEKAWDSWFEEDSCIDENAWWLEEEELCWTLDELIWCSALELMFVASENSKWPVISELKIKI